MFNIKGLLLKIYDQVKSEIKRSVLNLCEENPNAELLDCGCADGEFTLEVAQRLKTKKVTGIEISKEDVSKSSTKGIRVFNQDLNQPLPFQSETFDVVVANEVIEYLYHTDIFIKEILRLLKPGGYLVLSTGNLASLHNILFLLSGKLPLGIRVSDEVVVGTYQVLPDHTLKISNVPRAGKVFTPIALKELLQYHGFQVEKIVGVGFYPFPVIASRALSALDKRHSAYIVLKAMKPRRRQFHES